MAVTTSITIQFNNPGGATDGSLSAEIDSRPDGYNSGKTSFIPGDTPAFLVFKSTNVTIDSMDTSASGVTVGPTSGKTNVIAMDETILFVDSLQQSLKYAPDLSPPPVVTLISGVVPGARVVGSAVVCDDASQSNNGSKKFKSLGVVRVTYSATALPFRLAGVPTTLNGLTEFPVAVVITGSVNP